MGAGGGLRSRLDRVGVWLGVVGLVLLAVPVVVLVVRHHDGGGAGAGESVRVTLVSPKLGPGGTYAVPGSSVRVREHEWVVAGDSPARLPYLSVSGLASEAMDASVSANLKKYATDVVGKGSERSRWKGTLSVVGVNADLLSMSFVYWNELSADGFPFSVTDNIDLRSGESTLMTSAQTEAERLRTGEILRAHAPSDFCGTLPSAKVLADDLENEYFVLFSHSSVEFYVPTIGLDGAVACGVRTIDVPYDEMGGSLPPDIKDLLAGV
ncbi:hypothetical protein AB0M29_15665 [Streptomyces sp. NPDC051976]|uniref:hypothetical protein n=1 Tax=Streptomyces sp. NPDC051976 TaxID=3154947 RepID=UPI0034361AE9